MKKMLIFLTIVPAFLCCKKSITTPTCNLQGKYLITVTNSSNVDSMTLMSLKGSDSAIIQRNDIIPYNYGLYSNNCDSMKMTVYKFNNNDTILFKGKLIYRTHDTLISGEFQSLKFNQEYGIFQMNKIQ